MLGNPRTPESGIRTFRRMFALCAAVVTVGLVVQAQAQVEWRSGISPATRKSPEEIRTSVAQLSLEGGTRHVVVEFNGGVTAARVELKASGVTLLNYLGNNAFFAALSSRSVDAVALGKMRSLKNIQDVTREWKLDPWLVAGKVPEWAVVSENADGVQEVALYVLFHSDVPLLTDGVSAVSAHGAIIRSRLESINGLVIEMPLENIDALAQEDAVQWIEWPLPQLSTTNDSNRAITGANTVQAAPYSLDGSGVNVLVYDGGTARSSHVDFEGRLTVRDGSGMSYHATHVCGTVGGGGVADSTYKGMAPGVIIESYGFEVEGGLVEGFLYSDPGDLEDDYSEAIDTYGVHLANNSIGTNTAQNGFPCEWEGNYGVTSNLIDTIVRGDGSNPLFDEPFRIIWANGNERGSGACGTEYHTTAPPACAKNHIAIGALNSNDDSMTYFSSWGPTDDDRLKPDVSAPGCQSGGDDGVTSTDDASDTAYYTLCGTSMSAQTVTGLASLLLEDYRVQFSGQPDPRNSTLKALFAHTAVDLGNTGPDYQFGYGSVRIQPAIDLMRSGKFVENQVSHAGTYTTTFVVAPGAPELRVTLAWDDYPGTPNVNPALVNDLDLVVTGPSPSTTRRYPWTLGGLANPSAAAVRTAEDHVNNLEQVLVDSPPAGTYTIEVYGYNVPNGPQSFSLVGDGASNGGLWISYPSGLPDLVPPGTPTSFDVEIVVSGETYVPGSGTLHYRYDGGTWLADSLTAQGGDLFEATLPAAACDDTPEYYISAEGTVSGVVTDPSDAPTSVNTFEVGEYTTFFDDDFETDQGWTVGDTGDDATTGIWDRADPEGTAAQPEDDHTPSPGTDCYVTDSRAGSGLGDWDVDGGKTTVKTPTIDLSSVDDATVSYWRWYSNDTGGEPNNDVFVVDISNNDGGSWLNVETVGPSGAGTSGGWIYHEFQVADVLTPTSQIKMRFVASDEGTGSLVEAAVDDFYISEFSCAGSPTCDDGILNQGEDRIDCGGPCPPCDCLSDGACANGQYCDGVETCDAYGHCQDGPDVDCNDGVPCTDDSCNEGTDSCDNVPNNALCDNGQYCDGVETCHQTLDCQAGPDVDCNDEVGCTVDSCNEGTDSCDNVPSDALCDNGEYCDGVETCHQTLDCQAGTEVDCNDGVACTDDWCDEDADQCDNTLDHDYCDNGVYCDGVEICDLLLGCQAGPAVDCDDSVPCTDDSCNEGTDSCDNVPNDTLCDNGLYCDGDETCHQTLGCQAGPAVDCDDSVPCTDDSCNEGTDSCDNVPNDTLCDNGLYCDGDETCHQTLGCQAGTAVDCDDSVPCTDDSCNEGTDSCDNVPNDALCDNALYCDGVETCHQTLDCEAGTDVDCNDGVTCTDDSCNEGTDSCDNVPNDTLCDNGLYCDGDETCHQTLGCQNGPDVDCDDAVACTDDSCNEGTDSCDNITDDGYCDNDLWCDGFETCDVVLDCLAGDDPCPEQECDEENDECTSEPYCATLPNPAVCLGDVDGDGTVGTLDTGAIGAAFGATDAESLCKFDVDCDGTIGTLDVGAAQAVFGNCTPESADPCWME